MRKEGKLPAEVFKEEYELEYGNAAIEIHKDAICEDDIVLVHDDLLATGGTMEAARRLVEKNHPKAVYLNCIIELMELAGRKAFPSDTEITSILQV